MKQLVIIDTVRNTRKVVPENGQYIGRGKFIECDDKRISRTHGRISTEFKQEKLLLRLVSLHTNAIFCRKKDSDKDYTLNNDDIILLEIGDKFRLLQDGGWFEVGEATPEDELPSSEMSLSGVESNSHETVTEDDPSSKRKHETENDAGTSKKSRISDDDSLERPSTSSQSTNVPSNPDPELPTTESATAATIKPDPDSVPTSSTEVKVNIKPDPDGIGSSTGVSSNDPGVSGNIGIVTIKPDPGAAVCNAGAYGVPGAPGNGVLRPSCDYGIRCYRGGQDHRNSYAHPGDPDYRRPNFPPAPPGSPLCPFGARCYRRNPQHFQDFDHPDPNANVVRRPVRPWSLRAREAAPQQGYDYDYESLFEEAYPYAIDGYNNGPDFGSSSSEEFVPDNFNDWNSDETDDEDIDLQDEEERASNDSGLDC